MERHTLNINDHKYLIDYTNVVYDNSSSYTISQYIMIRNFDVVNDIIIDKDLIFIDKRVFINYINNLKSGKTNDIQVFPINNSKLTGYSNNITSFNGSLYNNDLFDIIDENNNINTNQYVYLLYDNEHNEKYVKNNIIKLYHPTTQITLNGIICIKSIINNINVYFLCNKINEYTTYSNDEIRLENNNYSEYIKIEFPNIEDLFDINKNASVGINNTNFNTYYIENLNIVNIVDDFINGQTNENVNFINNETQYIPLNLIIQPYKIVLKNIEGENMHIKEYVNIKYRIENRLLTYPFIFSIFPYNENINDIYQLADNLSIAQITITSECKITLSSKLGFNEEGKISINSEFIYPNFDKYKTFKDAYLDLNNISISDYDDFYENIDNRLEDINYSDISELELDVVTQNLKIANKQINEETILEEYKRLLEEQLKDEYADELGLDPTFIGFRIEIATDNNFNDLIYYNEKTIKLISLPNKFNFAIDGIFDDWNQKPQSLICRCMFIDKYLGIKIVSNFVVITKEWFKYIIRHNIPNLINKIQYDNNMQEIILNDDTKFNFINNIKCIIKKEENNIDINSKKISDFQKIVFKPIFYKVQNLQNIQIRQTVKQNIGINLADYMTKVNAFKLIINNEEIIESARNDMYVIFNIDGKKITSYSGKYDIVNQDDEYISSGGWTLV